MDLQDYPSRYLYISGAFAVGGTFTRIAPDVDIHMQVPTIAPVHLPMVGGTSEARHKKKFILDFSTAKFGRIGRKRKRQLQKQEALSVGAARSLAQTEPEVAGRPFVSRSLSEVESVRIADGFFLKYGLLNLTSTHDPRKSRHPQIRFGKTEIRGLRLGKSKVKITLDVGPFNKYPTLEAFETAFQKDSRLRQKLSSRFVMDPKTGGLHKNESGYVIGTLVQKVEGLPDDASFDGFTITWPKFGKIILGEVLMGPYVRRVTLVRFKHSDGDIGSGCSGGSTWP
jgi:hypothetical protein